jgi:tetratricopeptide (TPR) repeat protein
MKTLLSGGANAIGRVLIVLCLAAAFAFGAESAKEACDRGVAAQNRGDYQEAIKQYTEAIKADPKYAEAYNYRALAYAALHNYVMAFADFAQALKIDPSYWAAYVDRGAVYEKLGDYKSAIADYTQAIKIDPKDAKAYNNRGAVYYNLGDYKSATKDARKACELGNCELLGALGKDKLIRD